VAGLQQSQFELYALCQRTAGIAQADAFSSVFLAIALICFAGAVLALFMPSGKPAAGSSAGMAH